jgi:SAM-dependent methyltransferase
MQKYEMLKDGLKVIKKQSLHYIVDDGGNLLKFKPWLGDAFSFLYDFIMKNSIFPKKFGGDMLRHYEILSKELKGVHKKRILELATGSGTDISPGLLRKAVRNFKKADFNNAEFYVTSADDLPFDDNFFDIVLCILSLNFFSDIKKVLQEVERVASPAAIFICSVPVPERNKIQSTIRGTLYSEGELGGLCEEHGLRYETIPLENGALLYFRAIIKKSQFLA